jgi:hypothetical protein
VTLLLYASPHALALVLLACAVVWGLQQTDFPGARAVAGAVAIWLAENAVHLGYYVTRYRLARDPDGFETRVYPVRVKRQALVTAALNLGPGLWIGLVSQSPVATAIATRLGLTLMIYLSRLRVAAIEGRSVSVRGSFTRLGIDLAWMIIGALIGRLVRLWP